MKDDRRGSLGEGMGDDRLQKIDQGAWETGEKS